VSETYAKTYSDVEILALSEVPAPKIAATIKQGENLDKGAVIAQETASGLYVAYDSAGVDGSEEAAGILSFAVNATATGDNRNVDAAMYIGGAFYEDKLPDTITPAIKTALGARSIPGRNLLIF